jgi:signal peptidase I
MSKKEKRKKVEVEEPQAQEEVAVKTAPVVKEPQVVKQPIENPGDNWEIKDRTYYLIGRKNPISYSIRAAGIYWFDEEKKYERELKNTTNQRTPFVDEFPEGSESKLEHIVFRNGSLFVPRNKQTLQKLLSLYHPHRGRIFEEFNPIIEATNEIENLELETDALLAARNMDIDIAEAIMRVEIGSKVSEMSSKEIRRDLMIFAKREPKLLLDLLDDDNVILRNFGIKAVEMGIIRLSQDQRTFIWNSNNRKLMNVPFDEHPYSALAHWFKTDEGMEIYSNIEKRLNS